MTPLPDDLLHRMHAWWRAANYLNIGQIYLMENPLLREPLRVEHITQHFEDLPEIRDWVWTD